VVGLNLAPGRRAGWLKAAAGRLQRLVRRCVRPAITAAACRL